MNPHGVAWPSRRKPSPANAVQSLLEQHAPTPSPGAALLFHIGRQTRRPFRAPWKLAQAASAQKCGERLLEFGLVRGICGSLIRSNGAGKLGWRGRQSHWWIKPASPTSHRRARYGQVRQILAQANRRWVSATGRRSAIKGRLPAHFLLSSIE